MSEEAINDVQKALNAVRAAVAEEDRETQLATLALLVDVSDSVIQSARALEGETTKVKTKTQKVAVPQTRVIAKQEPDKSAGPKNPIEPERRDVKPRKPQAPLSPQQQRDLERRRQRHRGR